MFRPLGRCTQHAVESRRGEGQALQHQVVHLVDELSHFVSLDAAARLQHPLVLGTTTMVHTQLALTDADRMPRVALLLVSSLKLRVRFETPTSDMVFW